MSRVSNTPISSPAEPAAGYPIETKDILSRLLAEIQKADAEVGRRLSLTASVQLTHSWLERRYQLIGWGRAADIFRACGYAHANAKNVQHAHDSELSNFVRSFAASDEGRAFVAQLEALIEGRAAALPIAVAETKNDSAASEPAKGPKPARAPRRGRDKKTKAGGAHQVSISNRPAVSAAKPSPRLEPPARNEQSPSLAVEPSPTIHDRLE